MRSKVAFRVAAAAVLAACSAPLAVAGADPAPPPGPAPGPAPAVSMDKDGTYEVGAQIAPGTYKSAGPVDNGACYWKRVSGDKLVDNAMSKKAQVVQIDATDTSFKTSGCQPWQKIEDCLPGCGPATTNPMDILSQLGGLVLNHPGGPPAGTP